MKQPFVRPLAAPLAQPPSTARNDGSLGPELSPAITGGWTLIGSPAPTQNGSGIHFSAAANLAAAHITVNPIADNETYEVTYTVANYTGGQVRVLVCGDTTNHAGVTTDRNANGTYTQRVTASATSSLLNQIRVQATGTSGTNTFDITFLSVKKVFP